MTANKSHKNVILILALIKSIEEWKILIVKSIKKGSILDDFFALNPDVSTSFMVSTS